MTYVGKILVIVIMVFSLFFLALSTVVFTTEVNWKKQVTDLNETQKKLQDEKRRLVAEVQTQKAALDQAAQTLEKSEKGFRAQVKDLTDSNNRRQSEITEQRTKVETALEQVKSAQAEAEARISESNVLRQNLQAVQAQRDEFRLQNVNLDQQIILLKRDLDVAVTNNKNLRERVTALSNAIRRAGLDPNVSTSGGPPLPPHDVEGEVTRVSADGKTLEISIGKDDGLSEGNELVIYRTKPSPEYIGKVRVMSVDPDQAAVKVIGNTYHGKKIQEGDNVSTKIRPRG